jgi:hypothetical protein
MAANRHRKVGEEDSRERLRPFRILRGKILRKDSYWKIVDSRSSGEVARS